MDTIINIRRVVYPVKSLGPGNRICLWTAGCSHTPPCKGCISPELRRCMLTDRVRFSRIKELLRDIVDKYHPDGGLTISGGDPMDQPRAVLELCRFVRDELGLTDILMFTGYEEAELPAETLEELRSCVSVAVFGRYVEALNEPTDQWARLRGSTNQTIRFFDPELEPAYSAYCAESRSVEVVHSNNRVILVGIP